MYRLDYLDNKQKSITFFCMSLRELNKKFNELNTELGSNYRILQVLHN